MPGTTKYAWILLGLFESKTFECWYIEIWRLVVMEITWIEQQANGIEVEETEISQEEFDRLFGD
jgi:hypothetical protein